MSATKCRLAFFLFLALLTVASVPAWAGTGPVGKPCLSADVGEVLSAKIAAHAFDGALPAGWVFEEIGIEADHIELGALDGDKHLHNISLRLGEGVGDAIAGRGRLFTFVIEPGSAPIDDAGKAGLLELAARVDSAVSAGADSAAHGCGQGRAPFWVRVGATFYALVLAGVAASVWRCRKDLLSRQALFPALLTLLALCARFVAHAGAGDIRNVLQAGVGDGFRERAGWSCLLRLVFAVLPPVYPSIWAVHRFVGALAVPLLYCALRQRFTRRPVAAAGAAALAVLPLAVRFSASDTPYIPLCTAFIGSVVALTQFRRTGSRGSLVLGVLLLTAAMQLRPDGPWLVVPAAILVLTVPAVATGRLFQPATLLAGGLFLMLNAIPSIWGLAGHNHAGDGSLAAYVKMNFVLVGSLHGSPWADFAMSPWPLSLLVAVGLVLAIGAGRSGVGWALATLLAMPLSAPATEQYANARYHLPAVYLACGLAGIATNAIVDRAARWLPPRVDLAVLATVITVIGAIPRLDLLTRQWTPQQEFEFYRAGLERIDPWCTIVSLMDGQDAGFVPFSDPGAPTPMDIGVFLEKSPSTTACVVYYRAASCRSADAVGLPKGTPFDESSACHELERRATLTPIVETTLPARPYRGERYSVDPVPVGFYRITSMTPR